MKTRIVHTKIWKDSWFANLSKDAKLLWKYLLTNEKINISGIYELSDREICFDTSIDTSLLSSLKSELYPKAQFLDGWVKIANVDKYNKYRNSPMNEIAYQKEISYIPQGVRNGLGIKNHTSIDTSIDTLRNKKPEIRTTKYKLRNTKQEIGGQPQIESVGEILEKKREQCG